MVETIFGGFLFEFVPSSAALFQRLLENAQASGLGGRHIMGQRVAAAPVPVLRFLKARLSKGGMSGVFEMICV